MSEFDDYLATINRLKYQFPPNPELPATYWDEGNAHVLMPDRAREELVARGQHIQRTGEDDYQPLVKLFAPDAGCTWLIVSLDPGDPTIAYGIADLGLGCAEVGSFSLTEIAEVRGTVGLPVERDLHFHTWDKLGVIADRARRSGWLDV